MDVLLYSTISHHSQFTITNCYDKGIFSGGASQVFHVQLLIKFMNKTYKQH